MPLPRPISSAVDGEGNPVVFDAAYPLRRDFLAELAPITAHHGAACRLLPLSGMSCGGGILQSRPAGKEPVVGLCFQPPAAPRVRTGRVEALADVALDEIVIDPQAQEVCAGAAVTLVQLNQALAAEPGGTFQVLGADLTSARYAAVGATFMTGGMGPQRRYFSDSVTGIARYDGEQIVTAAGTELPGLAATYGWSGIVTAVRCRYCRIPDSEVAFALPVRNEAESLARLLAHLAPFAFLEPDGGRVGAGAAGVVFGIEHVTAGSMGPLLAAADHPMAPRARQLAERCGQAGADGLVFINGFSDLPAADFLQALLDDPGAEPPTLAGIDLEHTELFDDPEAMRDVREAIPYTARRRSPAGRHVFKNHSDATVRLHPERVGPAMEALWRCNEAYVAAVEALFAERADVDGSVLVYGHLNPCGVDPHNRVTFGCDDEAVFRTVRDGVTALRARFYRDLVDLCAATGSVLVGGEKGADSERGIFRACGGPESAPAALREKFHRQRAAIAAASPRFSWRALAPYAGPCRT